ncbi:RadA [Halovirus HCTV-5]|uniref:RadA n=1 Tax=Halovirus HCTV-5 TaxID=1273748 RepID=UPI0003348707|nr:RadA [Halovirus HCTV-5]AGM11707.1 RadA [Halovirus HCTV-5]
MTELERLAGVGPKTAGILRDAGYESAEEVLEEDDEDLLSIEGIGRGLVMKMEITEERNLKGIRVPRDWRTTLKEAVDGTEYTLSDALRVLLPDDVEAHRMEIPEDEYVSVYVEEDVHEDVNSLAGENVTALDVLDRYLGDTGSEMIRAQLDNELSADDNDENNDD